MPAYFEVFGARIYSYAIFTILGLCAVAGVCVLLSRRRPYSLSRVGMMALCGLGGMYVGAHILYGLTMIPYLCDVIAHWSERIASFEDVWAVLNYAFGGMVYYGGLLGLFAGIALYMRWKVLPDGRLDYWDLTAVCVPLFHAFGRLGCFAAGCCYGVRCEWGGVSEHTLNSEVNGVARLPVQLIESGFEFLLFALLLVLFWKSVRRGRLLLIYCLCYPIARFVLEFFRDDAIRGMWGPFSTSQWISIALFLVALVLAIRDGFHMRPTQTTDKEE